MGPPIAIFGGPPFCYGVECGLLGSPLMTTKPQRLAAGQAASPRCPPRMRPRLARFSCRCNNAMRRPALRPNGHSRRRGACSDPVSWSTISEQNKNISVSGFTVKRRNQRADFVPGIGWPDNGTRGNFCPRLMHDLFADYTGHETFKGHPMYGLGGCAVMGRDIGRRLAEPWRAVRRRITRMARRASSWQ
jgi:hypothetical protein